MNHSGIGIRDAVRSDEKTEDTTMLKQKYATSKKMVTLPLGNVAENLLKFVAFCVSWISTPSEKIRLKERSVRAEDLHSLSREGI